MGDQGTHIATFFHGGAACWIATGQTGFGSLENSAPSQAWLAVGVAAWTEDAKDSATEMIDPHLQTLLVETPGRIRLHNQHNYLGRWAFENCPEVHRAWREDKDLESYQADRYQLENDFYADNVIAQRAFRDQLFNAFRELNTGADRDLFIQTEVGGYPQLGGLWLRVSSAERDYGSISFKGRPIEPCALLRELHGDLILSAPLDNIMAWRWGDDEPVRIAK